MQVCRQCATRFALGLAWCPHCHSADWYDEDARIQDPVSQDGDVVVSAAVVRAWAREAGVPVPVRGRVPADVVAAYRAAH